MSSKEKEFKFITSLNKAVSKNIDKARNEALSEKFVTKDELQLIFNTLRNMTKDQQGVEMHSQQVESRVDALTQGASEVIDELTTQIKGLKTVLYIVILSQLIMGVAFLCLL